MLLHHLSVEIEVPGNWFGGSLTNTEKREKYKAQAVEYADVREFPGPTRQSKKTKDPAIRFICIADAAEDPNSAGYWMKLSQWNQDSSRLMKSPSRLLRTD